MTAPTLLWFRRDLRLADQPALAAAIHDGPVVPVYILDDETPKHRMMGAASRWWLHHSLSALDEALRAKGSRLILRRGKCDEELAKVAEEVGAGTVHAIRHYEPWWRNAERAVGKRLDLVCEPPYHRDIDAVIARAHERFARELQQHATEPAARGCLYRNRLRSNVHAERTKSSNSRTSAPASFSVWPTVFDES